MIKLYKYLFYRLYSWNLKTWGKNDLPQLNAILGVSFMMILNFGIIAGIIDIFESINIFIEKTPKKELILIFLLVLIINYFWLIHNSKYKKIVEEYKNESKKIKFRRTILLWLYLIVSFITICLIAELSGRFKGLH